MAKLRLQRRGKNDTVAPLAVSNQWHPLIKFSTAIIQQSFLKNISLWNSEKFRKYVGAVAPWWLTAEYHLAHTPCGYWLICLISALCRFRLLFGAKLFTNSADDANRRDHQHARNKMLGSWDRKQMNRRRLLFWFRFNAACRWLRPASAGPGSGVARGYHAVCWCQLLAALIFGRIRWGGLLPSEETPQQFTKHWSTPANLIIGAPMMSASRRLRSAHDAICLRREPRRSRVAVNDGT